MQASTTYKTGESPAKKTKKKNLSTVFVIIIIIAGLSLLLYPNVSDYWNSLHQTRAIVGYSEEVSELNDDEIEALWKAAEEYNSRLSIGNNVHTLSDQELDEYLDMLALSENSPMAYVEIPSISCSLPVYHGVSDEVLQTGVGHLEWSSLPVGGESTHCVLSGHRGLPSARLFTNLNQLKEGDTFSVTTLNRVLTYEVDQILIVEPDQTDALNIIEGEDLCTLVTCTPYGVNSHRLFVRGHRVPTEGELRITADATQIEPKIVAPFIAIPILILMLIWVFTSSKGSRDRTES